MKTFLIQLTIVIALVSSSQKCQAQEEVVTYITEGAKITKQVYTTITWAFAHKEQITMIFRGFHYNHRWWACIYQDNFITYNDFRSYRNSMDAYNYFVLGHGDCQAVYSIRQNNAPHICYENPLQARRYSDQHGPIVDIQYQDDHGNYRSIFSY